jgi:hypothetical protein
MRKAAGSRAAVGHAALTASAIVPGVDVNKRCLHCSLGGFGPGEAPLWPEKEIGIRDGVSPMSEDV